MIIRLVIFMFMLSTACQTGRIPCPKNKTARLKKNSVNKPFRQYMASISNHANEGNVGSIHDKFTKVTSVRPVNNISVEDWDCPRPHNKKYLPKSVKVNIKENFKKITAHSDSLESIRSYNKFK